MLRTQDSMDRLSNILSDVMDDIGVNDRILKARRSASMLRATITQLGLHDMWKAITYEFGSQSEGSTTADLNSDRDIMLSSYEINVIHDQGEHKPGTNSLLVIQNETISPSYCHLQLIRSDECSDKLLILGNNVDVLKHCVTDSEGRLLLKNTSLTYGIHDFVQLRVGSQTQIHGPAACITNSLRHSQYTDIVYCFYSETLPYQVRSWLQRRKTCDWPTADVLGKCEKVGCFFVPADSKLSSTPELEWRISTHLQERYIMFSLNITQLRCYVLMKVILKTSINYMVEDVLSSYMCKNVLLYSVSESPHDWHTGSLLSKLKSCLIRLQKCVEHVNCPHFIVPENNLMAGRISDIQRIQLLDIIDVIVTDITSYIFDIKMDSISARMRMKLCGILYSEYTQPTILIYQRILSDLSWRVGAIQKLFINTIPEKTKNNILIIKSEILTQVIQALHRINQCRKSDIEQIFPHTDTITIRTACRLVIPVMSSTLGTLLAGRDIASNLPISDEAFIHLTEGKDSDVLSGRLKLLSVLYCTGDMKKTEEELDTTLEHYHNNKPVILTCGCWNMFRILVQCMPKIKELNEKTMKSSRALCVTFLPHEIKCVPHELKYEILRSYIEEDKINWTIIDNTWMDFIVVDSIPFLYYLQYKTSGGLHRRGEQLQALQCLADVIVHEPNLGHRETALNLLGQCCEKENMQTIALKCYISSLKHRKRNNAARLLLCLQLFKLKKQT